MIGIVIVNYKNEFKTIEFVKSQLLMLDNEIVVVIVNNEATVHSSKLIFDHLHSDVVNVDIQFDKPIIDCGRHIYILNSEINSGFAIGNNLGARFLDAHFDIDYFLFTNNDIILNSKHVLDVLITKINNDESIGAIGPKVIGLDGNCQSPELFESFVSRWFLRFWAHPIYKRDLKFDRNTANSGFYYRLMGSFFIMRRSDFIAIDLFDEGTFLYAEELILSEKLGRINKQMYYESSVSVIHEHNQTIGKFINTSKRLLLMFDSEAYYYRKYLNVSDSLINLVRISLLVYIKIKRYV